MHHWWQVFIAQIQQTSWLEWLGVGFGVAEVLLARANKVGLYPCGIISVLITIYLFIGNKLYAESLLNVYYLVMSIYGWWLWLKRGAGAALQISKANAKDWYTTWLIVGAAFITLYFLLKFYTDSTVPLMDAFVSATAWAGMWLLAKRKLENWILLNISNAAAIPLLFYKSMPLYALLTLFLFIIAIFGYMDWRRKLIAKQQPA